MLVPNNQLKYAAKYKIRKHHLKPVAATLLFLLVLMVMGFLALRLVGYTQYLQSLFLEFYTVLSEEYSDLGSTAEGFSQLYMGVMEGLYKAMDNIPPWKIPPVGGLLALGLVLMMLVFHAGYSAYCLHTAREEAPKMRELMAGFSVMGKVLGIHLLRMLLVGIGLMLFVVPGIIAWYRTRLALMVFWDHPEYGAMQCLRESAQLGRVLPLISLDLSFLGWHFLNYMITAFLMTPVLMLWVMPFARITLAEFYNRAVEWSPSMKRQAPPEDQTEE